MEQRTHVVYKPSIIMRIQDE